MDFAALPNNPMNFTENQHGNVILERLRQQRDSGHFCDVTLYVEGKQFRAHRNVLASCSPYFNSILKMQRIVKEHLTITCKSSEVFQSLLNYMYTGSVVIDKENVCELVRLANHFLVPKLKSYCSEYLERYLEVSNCVSVREMAEKYTMHSLLKCSSNFIKNNIEEVMKKSELLNASITIVESFLSDDAWTVPQNSLLPFITKWVVRDVTNREQHTRKLLTFVDWTAMDQHAITDHVDRDPLYPQSEVALYAVLQALLSNNLLFNKYQIIYDSLHSKFNQASQQEGENEANSVPETTSVKEELPSPAGSPPPAVYSSNDADGLSNERKSPESDPLAGDREDGDITFEGHYSEDSSDNENSKYMKEESIDGDASFSKEEPMVEIRVDQHRSTYIRSKVYDEDDDLEDNGAEDLSGARDSDDSYTESGPKRRTRSGGVQKKRRKVTKPSYTASGARRGRPPGTGKRQREAALWAAAQLVTDDCPTPLEGEEHLAVKKLKCKQCKFRACDEAELDRHVNDIHQGSHEVIYKCDNCDFTCSYIKEYYRHLKKHFPGPPFKCDNCDYQCEKMVNLVAHRSKTCDEKPHHCTMCDYKCRSRPYLLVHMRSHTGELPYKCETCGRAYAMRSTLEQHLTSHSTEQPYLCDACGFATKYIAHLMAHKRIHTGDVHRCTFPECKYSTPKKSQLISHARTHEGVRPHTCHICGRGFLEKSHLVRHERIHLDDKPFKCEQCDYASSRRDKLKEHYTRHHGDTASARVPYKLRMPRAGESLKGDEMGDDFNIDNASSTHSSNHGMNLTSSSAVSSSLVGAGPGEMAELLLAAHNMTAAQQHLKYATTFAAGLSAGTSDPQTLAMDYHPQQQQMQQRLSLVGVPSNGEALHSGSKESMSQLTHTSPSSSSVVPGHHMHQSAAAMAAMMLDGRVGYHQPGIAYTPVTMPQITQQTSSLPTSQASDYASMSSLF